MDRRTFLGAASAGAAHLLAQAPAAFARPVRTRRILVLGGTNFVGPALVEAAVARDHRVVLFNRGVTRPYLFPALEKLRGHPLRGR